MKLFKQLITVGATLFVFLSSCPVLSNQPETSATDDLSKQLVTQYQQSLKKTQSSPVNDLGKQLVINYWKHLKEAQSSSLGLDAFLASGYQSIHEDGTRDRAAEMVLAQQLNLREYKLDNFVTTKEGPVLIVTYTISTAETIANKRLVLNQSPRMSIFLKTKTGWKIIAHANLAQWYQW